MICTARAALERACKLSYQKGWEMGNTSTSRIDALDKQIAEQKQIVIAALEERKANGVTLSEPERCQASGYELGSGK